MVILKQPKYSFVCTQNKLIKEKRRKKTKKTKKKQKFKARIATVTAEL